MTDVKDPKEGQYLGTRLTIEGRKELRWVSGKEVEVEPVELDSPIKPLHPKFRDKHRVALMAIMGAIEQLKTIDRNMPILREEMINKVGMEKQVIKDLIDYGYLDQEVIPMAHAGRQLGGRAVITPTIESRKLYRVVEEALKNAETVNEERSTIVGGGEPVSQESVGAIS